MYEDFYSQYLGIENNVKEAASIATSHSVSSNICTELQTIITDLTNLNSFLQSEDNDDAITTFSSSISTNISTIESINSFLSGDYVNVESVYQSLKTNLELLKTLDEQLKTTCDNEPKQSDFKKNQTTTSYNAAGEPVETTVKVNDTKKFNEAHDAWEKAVEALKTDCKSVKKVIDESLVYLESINVCLPTKGASGIKIPPSVLSPIQLKSADLNDIDGQTSFAGTESSLTVPLETAALSTIDYPDSIDSEQASFIDPDLSTSYGNVDSIQSLTCTYYSDVEGPIEVHYAIIPADNPPMLSISTAVGKGGKDAIYRRTPMQQAMDIGATLAVNISLFGGGRNGKRRDGGSGIEWDGEHLFVGSHYDTDTTLYMTKDGQLSYFDNKTVFRGKSKAQVAQILEDNNVAWAAKGFYPIIANGQNVNSSNTDPNIYNGRVNKKTGEFTDSARHPRTFIGQLENGDYIIGVSDGRFRNEQGKKVYGMTLDEVADFATNYAVDASGNKVKVKFLYNADGGGSSAYIEDGEKKNWSDWKGNDRPTNDILYVRT